MQSEEVSWEEEEGEEQEEEDEEEEGEEQEEVINWLFSNKMYD